MIKRQLIIIGILALGLTMIGFGTQYVKEPMTISQAQLTNQESQLASLVNSDSMIYDFTADRDAKTVSFEYSGLKSITCPANGNHHSVLKEITIPGVGNHSINSYNGDMHQKM